MHASIVNAKCVTKAVCITSCAFTLKFLIYVERKNDLRVDAVDYSSIILKVIPI